MQSKIKTLYYRGFIKSCNYHCPYCPFAKKTTCINELIRDQKALKRFYEKIAETAFEMPIQLLLTPYGEGLIHNHVQQYMAQFSRLPQIQYIGIQTNLSCDIKRLIEGWQQQEAEFHKIKLWCSFHPDMVEADEFARKIIAISTFIEVSVGVVGNPSNIEQIKHLRALLPPSIYIWVNRMDGLKRRYTLEEITFFKQIDPFFDLEQHEPLADYNHCLGGRENFFIEATGDMYPCNRSKAKLGNLYEGLVEQTACKCNRCDCYLAYSNLTSLQMLQAFGDKKAFRLFEKHHYQAIFIDIDGTLLDADGKLSKAVVQTVVYLSQKAKLYLVTARSYVSAMQKCRAIRAFISGGIFENGMLVQDFETGQTTKQLFDDESLAALRKVPLLQEKALKKELCSKILLHLSPAKVKQLTKSVEGLAVEIGKDKHTVYITPQDCNKASKVLQFCKDKGWEKEEILVAGNSENDQILLRTFPYSVAMPNSLEAVRSVASYYLIVEQLPLIIE